MIAPRRNKVIRPLLGLFFDTISQEGRAGSLREASGALPDSTYGAAVI